MTETENYKLLVRKCLNRLTDDLSEELKRIYKLDFHPGVEVVQFVVSTQGFDECFPVVMFSMTKDGNEFFSEDKQYFSGSLEVLKKVKRVFSDKEVDLDNFYDKGVDVLEEAAYCLIEWFSETWKKTGGKNFPLPAYIEVHDRDSFDLINEKWINGV